MKRLILISITILLFVMTGCRKANELPVDVVTINVESDYPTKELILQDFMDVEYIPLETTDEFLNQGFVQAIGKNLILIVNNRIFDGDIFIYDRTGKALRKINHRGHSGEEYTYITDIVLDEDNNEMFILDNPLRKILVYDLNGNFKRSFRLVDTCSYIDLFNYDKDHLICYKDYSGGGETEQSCHILISKQDGSVTREMQIPIKGIATPVIMSGELTVMPAFQKITPYNENSWLLVRPSSDTVYSYLPDGNITPFMVRTPSIHSMNIQIFFYPTVITDRYYFMKTLRKEIDLKTMKGYPGAELVYDKQENAIFQYIVYNDDYTKKKQLSFTFTPVNHEIAFYRSLQSFDLIEAYEKKELKGRLKEIAAGLEEDANPVIMLVKYKK